MSSFTPTSYNSIELEDDFHTPIQGIGIATNTHTLLLSSVFYLLHVSYNLLSVSKITKVLNCTVTFFDALCISEAWDEENN